MNFVRRNGPTTVIRQVPIALLLSGAVLGLPPFAYGLVHVVRGTPAEGKYFCLFFGGVMIWLFLEYVATRERIEIDRAAGRLTRTVTGLFRRTHETADLRGATGIGVRIVYVPSTRGSGRREHLELHTPTGSHLLNTPAKVYLSAEKLGRLVSDESGVPFLGVAEPVPAGG